MFNRTPVHEIPDTPASQVRQPSPGHVQKNFAGTIEAALPEPVRGRPVEIWFQCMVRLRFARRNDSPDRPCFSVSGLLMGEDARATMGAAELQKPGGFSVVNPPPSGLVWHPFVMKLGFWLLPKEDEPRGFLPVLLAPDLYTFLVHEIVTLACSGRPLMFCGCCKELRREARRADCLYCSDACRQRAHRDRKRRTG